MSSVNFEMLRSKWPELANLGAQAEQYVHTDPESSLVKLRNYLELTVRLAIPPRTSATRVSFQPS